MDTWLQRVVSLNSGLVTDVAQVVTALGDPMVVLVLVVALTWRRWLRMSVLLVGSTALRFAYATLKGAIARERPDVSQQLVQASGYAMPSGHAAGVAFVAVVVVAFHPRFRWYAFAAAAMVGWSRIALGVHYPSDVLVGWGVGAAFGFACLRILERTESGTNLAD